MDYRGSVLVQTYSECIGSGDNLRQNSSKQTNKKSPQNQKL